MASVSSRGVQPFEPNFKTSIEEPWRWTELEALAGSEFRFAREGKNGTLWFAGGSEIAHYDGVDLLSYPLPEGETLQAFRLSPDGTPYSLTHRHLLVLREGEWEPLPGSADFGDRALRFEIGKDGDVWVAADQGLYRIFDDEIIFYETGISSVSSIVKDTNGRIWISQNDRQEIQVFDLKGEEIELAYRFEAEGNNGYVGLFLDSRGRVWVLSPDSLGNCYYYEDYERRLGMSGLDAPFRNTFDFEMAEGPSGRYWFCVARGLAELDGERSMVYERLTNLLPTAASFIVALSNEQLLIGGAESNTYLVDLSMERWASYPGLSYECEDDDGAYWFLHHDRRLITNGIDGDSWVAYDETDGVIDTPNRVFCSSDGRLWVSGQHRGAAAISYRDNGVWKRESFPRAGDIISHLGVLESSDGSMIFGLGETMEDSDDRIGGAMVWREVEGVVKRVHAAPPLFPLRPAILAERENDGFWIGGDSLKRRRGHGIPVVESVELFAGRRWVDHIVVDSRSDLWAAVWGLGVYQFDGESWNLHGEEEGLENSQVVNLLVGASEEVLWAVTASGLERFDGHRWSKWNVPFEEDFRREGHSLRESRDGALWINHAYRLWLLEGETDEKSAEFFRTIRYRGNEFGPYTEIVEAQGELPEGSPLIIEWRGADVWSETPESELEYSWRLDDGKWSGFSKSTSISLYDVKSGGHTFEVRTRDSDWNVDSNPSKVRIYVIPPMWKRPWFVLVVLATIAVIVVLANKLFKARVKTALAMEEFKIDFFTNISHELKNPLAVIMGPLESQLREEKSARARQRLKVALRNARKMQGLINQLLQFRKMELGKSTYRPASGELIGFLKEAIECQTPLWQEKGQQVSFATNEKYFVCGYDPDKLQKIVDNLLTNAIKYSGEGTCIRVGVDVYEKDGHNDLRLVVEDQGIGIPAHELDLVLKPFYRVRGSREEGDGFGLGLALVGELVQVWGGEINFESPIDSEGKGTRVTVCLPLLDGEQIHREEYEIEALESAEKEEEAPGSVHPKVLLVEDNLDLRFFMADELREHYEVLEAGDGAKGLEIAMEKNPDLIVSDVMMPRMDGFELCRRLRASPETSHIPIIILTAKSAEEHSVEGAEAGADAYFGKPLNMVRLSAQIENLLEVRRKLKLRFSEQLVIEPTELTIAPADQEIISRAIEVVEAHMKNVDFGVVQFAREMAMGRTSLFKKIKALTGMPPNSFIRSMRMKRAAQLLESGERTVSETLAYIGIEDHSYFSRTFKKEFGVSPSQYGGAKKAAKNVK